MNRVPKGDGADNAADCAAIADELPEMRRWMRARLDALMPESRRGARADDAFVVTAAERMDAAAPALDTAVSLVVALDAVSALATMDPLALGEGRIVHVARADAIVRAVGATLEHPAFYQVDAGELDRRAETARDLARAAMIEAARALSSVEGDEFPPWDPSVLDVAVTWSYLAPPPPLRPSTRAAVWEGLVAMAREVRGASLGSFAVMARALRWEGIADGADLRAAALLAIGAPDDDARTVREVLTVLGHDPGRYSNPTRAKEYRSRSAKSAKS